MNKITRVSLISILCLVLLFAVGCNTEIIENATKQSDLNKISAENPQINDSNNIVNAILDSANQVGKLQNQKLKDCIYLETGNQPVNKTLSENNGYMSAFFQRENNEQVDSNQDNIDELWGAMQFNGLSGYIFEVCGIKDISNSAVLLKYRSSGVSKGILVDFSNGSISVNANISKYGELSFGVHNDQIDCSADSTMQEYMNSLKPIDNEWYYVLVAIDEGFDYRFVTWQESNPANKAFYNFNLGEICNPDDSTNEQPFWAEFTLWTEMNEASLDIESLTVYEFEAYNDITYAESIQNDIIDYNYSDDYEKYQFSVDLFNSEDYYSACILLEELDGYSTSQSYLDECVRLLEHINIDNVMVRDSVFEAMDNHNIEHDNTICIYQAEQIESLDLSNCNIEGLSLITSFPNLKELYLDGNGISDLMVLKDLYRLERLSLANNNITVTLPLYNLTNLQYLDLSSNLLEDVKGLANLQSLRTLNLSKNNLITLDGLYNLENLEAVDLSYNFIYSVNALNHSKVKELNILNTNIDGLGAVGDIPELEVLKAGFKYIWRANTQTYLLTKRYENEIHFFMGMTGIPSLAGLKKIKKLYLSGINDQGSYNQYLVGIADLGHYQEHLQEVTQDMLEIPEYEDYWIDSQQDIDSLGELICDQNLVINIAFESSGEAIKLTIPKNIRNLYIHSDSENEIKIELDCIDHEGLERIAIGNVTISKDDPDGFGSGEFVLENLDGLSGCTNLREIYINSAKINDISGVADSKKLEIVKLERNNIEDLSPLMDTEYLKELNLNYNDIKSLEGLENSTRLQKLYIYGNPIGSIKRVKHLLFLDEIMK